MSRPPIVKPRALNEGALIAIVAPARPAATELLPVARSYLEQRGYSVVLGEHLFDHHQHYLAGTDTDRAQDLMVAFADPQIEAIICARGGYGSGRLLSLLDYDLVTENPKILVGFSDTTALQLALYHKCGLASFSGALADIDLSRPQPDLLVEESLWLALTNHNALGDLKPHPEHSLRIVQEGSYAAAGPLIPANLAVLCSLIGTPYMPDLKGAILLLEDVGEQPYRLDRMLNQLRLADILGGLHGLVLGEFRDCFEEGDTNPDLEELVLNATVGLDLTVALEFPYGHHARRMVVPLGIAAAIEGDGLRITDSAIT